MDSSLDDTVEDDRVTHNVAEQAVIEREIGAYGVIRDRMLKLIARLELLDDIELKR